MDQSQSRREFLGSLAVGVSAAVAGIDTPATAKDPTRKTTKRRAAMPGYETILLPPRPGTYEATLANLADGSVGLFYDRGGMLQMRSSKDHGRSWDDERPLVTGKGAKIPGSRTSPVRLKSGKLGLLHTGVRVRPGRDGKLVFRDSDDEGRTWSQGVDVDPVFAVLRSDCGRVLASGRLIAPVFIWISAYAGGESEQESHGFCFSWVYYSDDHGRTWKTSNSELFIAKDQGRGGIFQFEEPVVEELKDGRLLMLGRTETGRHYVSYSKDQGVTWTPPEPGAVAAAYCATLLRRIPSTGDLLMIWDQTLPREAEVGLQRHRLSAAISKDEGVTWGHFRNLESLDNVTRLDPPPAEPIKVHRKLPYRQPTDAKRYPHAPGPLRVCYPSVAFVDDEVVIDDDCDDVTGYKLGSPGANQHGTKLRVVPLAWLYA